MTETNTSLRELRERLQKTQVEVASKLDVMQSEVSRIETRKNHRVSTLRAFIEALGGKLEIVAKFGKFTFRIG